MVSNMYLHGVHEEEQRGTCPGEAPVNISLSVQLLRRLCRLLQGHLMRHIIRCAKQRVEIILRDACSPTWFLRVCGLWKGLTPNFSKM